MRFTISREALLRSLQLVIGATDQKQALPILRNTLLKVLDNTLTVIATDLQVEVHSRTPVLGEVVEGVVTVAARKLLDITRAFPENSEVNLELKEDVLSIKSGNGAFNLRTLSGEDFPNVEEGVNSCEFFISSEKLRFLIEQVYFSIAEQDVRYYLNGLFLEKNDNLLRVVTTDGHRLSTAHLNEELSQGVANAIIPRRCAMELMRFLTQVQDNVCVTMGESHLRVSGGGHTFISRLIDGAFPDYRCVVPKNVTRETVIERDKLKQMLVRAAILSNEKYHGLYLSLKKGRLMVEATNSDQEVAKDELGVCYEGGEIEGAYNVIYLLDATNALPAGEIRLSFSDGNNSIVLESTADDSVVYVIMPMRL